MLPLVLSRRGIHPQIPVLAILVALIVDVRPPFAPAPVLATIVLITGVTAAALRVWRALPRPALAAALVFLGLVGTLAGWREQRIYLRDRYRLPNLSEPVEPIASVLRRVSHARVAVTGFNETYPLYGLDLSNRVQLPAARVSARFAPYSSCRSWLIALQRGHYDTTTMW